MCSNEDPGQPQINKYFKILVEITKRIESIAFKQVAGRNKKMEDGRPTGDRKEYHKRNDGKRKVLTLEIYAINEQSQ